MIYRKDVLPVFASMNSQRSEGGANGVLIVGIRYFNYVDP